MEAAQHYATREDLAKLETRLVERIAGVESRLVERIADVDSRITAQISNLTWRLLGLLTAVAAVAVAFIKYL